MDTHMIVEMIGYIGSILVVISVLMSSLVKLRVINSAGALIFAIYALIIKSYPTALMNFCLVAINAYYLVRLKRQERHFELIDGKADDALLGYVLNYYKEDIKTYFPDWKGDTDKANAAYVVCCDGAPAGVLLGRIKKQGVLEVLFDYSTPAYRDCSVGKYLYAKLAGFGVHKLIFSEKSQKHEGYLRKMGFVKENGVYVKSV